MCRHQRGNRAHGSIGVGAERPVVDRRPWNNFVQREQPRVEHRRQLHRDCDVLDEHAQQLDLDVEGGRCLVDVQRVPYRTDSGSQREMHERDDRGKRTRRHSELQRERVHDASRRDTGPAGGKRSGAEQQ
jgi:hypothetical protein